MSGGIWELRRDEITGWWSATVVDRAFDPGRFAAERLSAERDATCANCAAAEQEGVTRRLLRQGAFHAVGTRSDAAHGESGFLTLSSMGQAGSWSTLIAPRGVHGELDEVPVGLVADLLVAVREQLRAARDAGATAYVQVVRNAAAQAGAMSDHLCLDLYDLPQVPHRLAEEIGGAARLAIRSGGGCAFCRLVHDEESSGRRVVHRDPFGLVFAPFAGRSAFETWIVPHGHAADFADADLATVRGFAETLQTAVRALRAIGMPPYNLMLHTAPLRERVDSTYHWHWELHPRLRPIGGLELASGIPVVPIAPEEAATELRRAVR
ncbi:MAG: galactose-phosphate uridylyltransferase [Chloroflexota bacterium]